MSTPNPHNHELLDPQALIDILVKNQSIMKELLQLWRDRQERYLMTPYVAQGMDAATSMGVQHGRTVALKECIDDLSKITGL